MKLVLDPECRCTLELKGQSVELSVAELATLRECFEDSDRPLSATLSRESFQYLFERGLLAPSDVSNATEAAYWQTALPALTLSPFLQFQFVFMADTLRMGEIEPTIAMFLLPEFVHKAQQLSQTISQGVKRAVHACAVRDTLLSRERTLALTHTIAWTWLQAHPDMARWITWGRDQAEGLQLSIPDYACLSTAQPAYPSVKLRVSVNTPNAKSQSQQVVMLLDALPQVTQVLDAVCREEASSIDESTLASVHVRRVLGAIESVGGFIERHAAPSVFASQVGSDVALAVTHMGHASLIIDTGGCRLLIDPWLFIWDEGFEKQPLVSSQLGHVDAIFFTHHHSDHLNADALMTLPHDVPVYVPCELGMPLEPRTAAFLQLLGFQDVRRLAHGELVSIGEDVRVEAVPFFGEATNRLGFGANGYLVSRHGRNILVHADASPDSDGHSLVSTGRLQEIVARNGPIQVVFGTWWQERQFVCQLSPLAIFSPAIRPEMWLDDTEMCDCPPDFLRDLVHQAGASHLVLYAESGKECFLPKHAMSEYVPSLSFLWQQVAELREILSSATGVEVVEAQPYLRILVPDKGMPYLDDSEVGTSRRRR